MQLIPLGQIQPSPTNPRCHFDKGDLLDLAASIRAKGVLQPILVRPWPADRPQPSTGADYDETAVYELIAGERRWRAAAQAGLATIPAIVKDLSDREVLEVQVIENDQRADVLPSERAAGYARLIEAGATIEELAKQIGKSVSTIRNILLLARLPESVRAALDTGIIPRSTAELIARVPGEQAREQAGREILAGRSWEKDADGKAIPFTYRLAKDHIEINFQKELKGAPFSQSDKKLYPEAGSCKDCPKRVGNLQKLDPVAYAGGRADVCTDPACYRTKCERQISVTEKKAQREGYLLYQGTVPPYGGAPDGYVELSQRCYELDENITWDEAIKRASAAGPEMHVDHWIAHNKDGKPLYFIREQDGIDVLDRAGLLPKPEPEKKSQPSLKQAAQSATTPTMQTWTPPPPKKPSPYAIGRKARELAMRVLAAYATEQAEDMETDTLGGQAEWVEALRLAVLGVCASLTAEYPEELNLLVNANIKLIHTLDAEGERIRDQYTLWANFIEQAKPPQLLGFLVSAATVFTLDIWSGSPDEPKHDEWKGWSEAGGRLLDYAELDWRQLWDQAERELTTGKPADVAADLPAERTCRECGCTEDNCDECLEKTGVPCHWVEDDLCSACADEEPEVDDPWKGEPIGVLGVTAEEIQKSSVIGKFTSGKLLTAPVSVKPIELNGKLYVMTSGAFKGGKSQWNVRPLHPAPEGAEKSGPFEPQIVDASGLRDYAGVVVKVPKLLRPLFVMGAKGEQRVLLHVAEEVPS